METIIAIIVIEVVSISLFGIKLLSEITIPG